MTSDTYIHADNEPVTTFVSGPQQYSGIVVVRIGNGPNASNGTSIFLKRASDCSEIAAAFAEAERILREAESKTEGTEAK
jgi:hypothetical protein